MGSEPVFRSRYEVDAWRRLSDGSWRDRNAFNNWIRVLLDRSGTADPHILVKAMETAVRLDPDGHAALVRRLADVRRPSDSLPLLTAASVLLDAGDTGAAEELLSAAGAGNQAVKHCIAARIAEAAGDRRKALTELRRAYCADPLHPQVYEIAGRIDPDGGWGHRRAIEELAAGGGDDGPEDGESPLQRLHAVYRNWFAGDTDAATRLLTGSPEFIAGDAGFLLASARMSAAEQDWYSARTVYDRVLQARPGCLYVVREAAEAHHRGREHRRALELYREAESLDPASGETVWGLVHAYRARGMTAAAVQHIVTRLDSESSCLDEHYRYARLLLDWDHHEEALRIIRRLELNRPDDPATGILHSRAKLGLGQPSEALDIVRRLVRRHPRDADCRVQHADVLMRMGRTARARKELDRVLKADAGNLPARELLLDMALERGDHDEVIRICERILELEPVNRRVSGVLASTRVMMRNGRDISASRTLARSFADPADLMSLASSLMTEGRADEVLAICDEHGRRFRPDPRVDLLRGNAEYALGRYLQASAAYSAAAVLDPSEPIAWHSKGMADERCGDLDAAEEAFNRAVLLDMNEPAFWISRSVIQELKGDPPGAVESLNRVIELAPGSVYALVRKGMILAAAGRYDEALHFVRLAAATDAEGTGVLKAERDIHSLASQTAMLIEVSSRILERDPVDAETVGMLAAAHLSEGDRGRAVAVVSKAVAVSPRSVPLLLERKTVLERIGDLPGAIAACEAVLAIQPGNSAVRDDLADLHERIGDNGPVARLRRAFSARSAERVHPRVKRQAERVLRRAHVSGMALDDPDLALALDIDCKAMAAVLGYLADIGDYGDIVPGAPGFERMETLSANAVIKGGCTGLEEDPLIPLPVAFVAGRARDADEAKQLVAYVHKAMTGEPVTEGLRVRAPRKIDTGMPVDEIVRRTGLGVCRARALKHR